MDVTWLGHDCVRLRGRERIVLMDPCAKTTGYSIGKQTADIVTVSRRDPEHAFLETLSSSPRVLDAAGEYEIGGVLLNGVQTAGHGKPKDGVARPKNIAFVVELDDLRVCHLGDLDHVPAQDLLEELSDIDLLLLPVGGHGALDAAAAAELISQLQPRLVTPLRYRTDISTQDLDPLEPFIQQLGRGVQEAQAKLTITRANLPEDTRVVVLDYRK